LNLWDNLNILDLIRSDKYLHWERKAGRIQYEFRTRLSSIKGNYLPFYNINSSGYNRGPFNREFHRKQIIKKVLQRNQHNMSNRSKRATRSSSA
jgi:hypothetical protein